MFLSLSSEKLNSIFIYVIDKLVVEFGLSVCVVTQLSKFEITELCNFLLFLNLTANRLAIRNVGHFEAPTYKVTEPFIKCYIFQFHHFLPYVFYCMLALVNLNLSNSINSPLKSFPSTVDLIPFILTFSVN